MLQVRGDGYCKTVLPWHKMECWEWITFIYEDDAHFVYMTDTEIRCNLSLEWIWGLHALPSIVRKPMTYDKFYDEQPKLPHCCSDQFWYLLKGSFSGCLLACSLQVFIRIRKRNFATKLRLKCLGFDKWGLSIEWSSEQMHRKLWKIYISNYQGSHDIVSICSCFNPEPHVGHRQGVGSVQSLRMGAHVAG